MDSGLGATQRLWVALVASLLLHAFLFVAAASRLPAFSFGSEISVGMHVRTVVLRFSRNPLVPDANSKPTHEPQTSSQLKNEDARTLDDATAPEISDRLGESQYRVLGLLTKLPQPIGEIDLNSPDITDQARQTQITLLLSVSSSGLVEKVKVLSPSESGAGEQWIARIVYRFRQSRFIPGEIDGNPVPTEFTIKVVVE